MIKKVNINMGTFLKDYRVMGVFNSCQCPPVKRVLQVTLHNLEPSRTETANGSCNSQFTLFTTEQQSYCSQQLYFHKPAYSTGQCKLKAIS
jgi:hypothetical protein